MHDADARPPEPRPDPDPGPEVGETDVDGLRLQALIDAERRTFVGSQLSLPGGVLVGTWAGLVGRYPWQTAGVLSWIGILGLARIVLHRRFAALATARPVRAAVLFRGLLLLGLANVGSFTGLSLDWHPLEKASIPLFVSAVVVSSAATVALALDSWARVGIPLVISVPIWLGVSVRSPGHALLYLVIGAAFCTYVLTTSRHVRADYWDAVRGKALLIRRAAELELMAVTDPLTGVANRLAFDRRLTQEWARAIRDRQPLSLLMVDIDHFKALNDRYGHPAGDACLVAVAAAIAGGVFRPMDLVARYGGEEFVILLPNTAPVAATGVAERVRAAVDDLVIDHGGALIRLTCSVGTTTALPRSPRHEASEALARADQALYAAKAAGRNRVVIGEALVEA